MRARSAAPATSVQTLRTGQKVLPAPEKQEHQSINYYSIYTVKSTIKNRRFPGKDELYGWIVRFLQYILTKNTRKMGENTVKNKT